MAFTSFLPAASREKVTQFSRTIHDLRLHRRTNLTLDGLTAEINPQVRGWLGYFTAFYPTAVTPVAERIDRHLMRWALRKYKRLKGRKPRARAWLRGVRQRQPGLFAHWSVNGHWEIRLGGLVFSGLAATSFPGWWPRVLPAGGG